MTITAPIEVPPQTSNYVAKWPEHLDPSLKSTCSKVWRVFWNIISIVIFPIGLYRLFRSWVHDTSVRWVIAGGRATMFLKNVQKGPLQAIKTVFQAGFNPHALDHPKADQKGEELLQRYGGNHLKITSPDGAQIDGAYFPGNNNKKAIVFSFGTLQQWERCGYILSLLTKIGVPILIVNPRGVGKSEGLCHEYGYPLDVYSGMQYLIREKGIDPDDILPMGFSMGAGYGTCAAAILQKEYPEKKIKMLHLLSFANLAKEVEHLMTRAGGFFAHTTRILAKTQRFDLDVKKAFDTLKGKTCIAYNPIDPVIPYSASLVRAVRKNTNIATKIIRMQPVHGNKRNAHLRKFTRFEADTLLDTVCDMLEIDRSDTHLPSWQPSSDLFYVPPIGTEPIRISHIIPIE